MNNWKSATASLSAIASVLASLSCCLPLGIFGALGAAGAGVFLARLRPWLLGLSVVLLVAGFVQLYRRPSCGVKRSTLNVVLVWASAAVVLILILFPQAIALLLADVGAK